MSAEKTDDQVKFRQIFESSRDAIMLIAPEGYIDCNEATLELFDVATKEDFKQLSPWKLSPPTQPDGSDSMQAAREHINRALEEGTDFFEWKHKRKDGQPFLSEVKLSSFELDDQKIVQALVRDITERKQREEELRATEQQLRAEVEDRKQAQAELKQRTGELRAVINAMPDACFVLDREGNYCQVMTNQEELLAAPPEELLDSNVVEQLPPKTAQKCLVAIERALDTREVQETEYSISVPAGELDFSARISPLGEDKVVFVARDITDLKERERELQEVKNRLELAVKGGNLGIWDWNMATDSVQYNEQWARMLGYSLDEIEPHLEAWKKRVHPDDLDEVLAALNAHIAGETEFYKKEQRMKTADGNWKWLLDVGKIFEWDEDGEPVRSVGIHIDIDERKRLERTLKEERDMFSRGPTVVFKWENVQSGRIKYVSDNVEDVLGYTPEQLLSGEITYNDIVHEEDHARVREEVITGRESEVEGFTHDPYRVVTADGEVRWVLDHTKNLWQDEEGAQLLGYVIDITRRKQMAEELRKNKERLDALLSNTPSVIYTYEVVDGAPETTYVSESVRNVLGHDPEYYVSDPENFMNDLHPEDAEELFEKEEKLLTDEDTDKITAEYRFKDKEGDYHWLRDEQKLLDPDGDRQRVIGSWWDITALKEQEKELKRSNEELEQFADKAAHDLKQPLSVISHSAELLELKNQDVLKEDSREYVETIVQKADLVSNLLDKLVDYARLDSQIEDFVPVDLEKIIASCCKNLEEHIKETQAEVIYEDLPPVEGDYPQLVRVFQNLIDNAIKYRDEDAPEIKISAESEQVQGVKVFISDNGTGIAPEEQDKIFDIFYRIKSSEEIAGTGIGLANCQKIIEQHGGKIKVDSELGEGTTFILTLPAVEGEN